MRKQYTDVGSKKLSQNLETIIRCCSLLVNLCCGLTQQPAIRTRQPLAHPSPSPQWGGEEKWTKGKIRGLR